MHMQPSILASLKNWRRAPAFVGLVALALLHISAATHQFEHAAEHDTTVCESCSAYSQLDDTTVPASGMLEIPATTAETVGRLFAPDVLGPDVAAVRSRAPPLS